MAFDDLRVKEFLTAIKNEAVKIFRAYDGANRVEFQYETMTYTKDQGPCMVTQYVYDGASSRVVKMKETIGVWDAGTMDI